ncbi:MAG: hypothetical protein ACRCXA_03655 [Peptostreptococcaceae bacterium]
MRWIVVFIFLYLIPIIILFKNNKNFKKACMYGGMYTVLATTIAISNIYMSGLNKIEEVLYYQNYANDQRYKDKYVSNFEKNESQSKAKSDNNEKTSNDKEMIEVDEKIDENKVNDSEEVQSTEEILQNKKISDLEKVEQFKKDIYDIERVALIPMRDCLPYTKNIAQNLSKISQIKEELVYAEDMCKDVIDIYDTMEIPLLSKEEYEVVLGNAKDDVQKAYELRQKAMESAIKLVDTKNPRYIGKITEYLKLSDNHIASFKERVNDLNNKINDN